MISKTPYCKLYFVIVCVARGPSAQWWALGFSVLEACYAILRRGIPPPAAAAPALEVGYRSIACACHRSLEQRQPHCISAITRTLRQVPCLVMLLKKHCDRPQCHFAGDDLSHVCNIGVRFSFSSLGPSRGLGIPRTCDMIDHDMALL